MSEGPSTNWPAVATRLAAETHRRIARTAIVGIRVVDGLMRAKDQDADEGAQLILQAAILAGDGTKATIEQVIAAELERANEEFNRAHAEGNGGLGDDASG